MPVEAEARIVERDLRLLGRSSEWSGLRPHLHGTCVDGARAA